MNTLLGCRMGKNFAGFHVVGILVCMAQKLIMFVRALRACASNYIRCKIEMRSGPVEDVFLSYRWSR